ncbi:MAG: helix-turn-helix transcriptional regulator [Chloroflexota bacterium]
MEALALEAGLSDKGQISHFENGQVVPTAVTLGKLLCVLQPEPALLYKLFGLG